MNPVLADVAEILGRLCATAPLVFAGLMLAIDPLKFLDIVRTISDGAQRFRDHLQSSPWADPFLGSQPVPDSQRTRLVARCVVLALATAGLVHLAGIVG